MTDMPPTPSSLDRERRRDQLCDDFETAWIDGERPRIEDYLARVAPEQQARVLPELIRLEIEYRRRAGEQVDDEEFRRRFPDHHPTGSEAQTWCDSQTPATESLPACRPTIPGYEILEEIDAGGMGVVYKARNIELDLVVALKVIRGGIAQGPKALVRFRMEAQAVAHLNHPQVVRLHEYGDCEGLPYFTMEFIEGGSLADKLKGGRLPVREAARLVASLAETMQYVHDQRIIHRDLKPANILVAGDGTFKIADFGLAKRLDKGHKLTLTHTALGTASYMAPEQITSASEAGAAADIYSLGAILYEVLTGRPPFVADTYELTVVRVLSDEPTPPSLLRAEVPTDLQYICLRCLRKDATLRYASAGELAGDLQAFLKDEPIADDSGSMAERYKARRVGRRYELLQKLDHKPGEAPGRLAIPGYEILGRLCEGPMGVVYKARQLSSGRLVALRVLPWTANGPAPLTRSTQTWTRARRRSNAIEGFMQALEALPALKHPNIAEVFEVGSSESRIFIVMELLDRLDLAQRLRGETWPVPSAIQLIVKLAEALTYAHERGVLHRDIKPANVLFSSEGTPKLSDFALAYLIDHDLAQTQMASFLVGTPTYMAPEQAAGDLKAVCAGTDIYALGVILYELLTGRPPFRGETMLGLIQKALKDMPAPPSALVPGIPRHIDAICLKCLEKEPARRYGGAREFAEDLQGVLSGDAALAATSPNMGWKRFFPWWKG